MAKRKKVESIIMTKRGDEKMKNYDMLNQQTSMLIGRRRNFVSLLFFYAFHFSFGRIFLGGFGRWMDALALPLRGWVILARF